jgi:hypothetical protein
MALGRLSTGYFATGISREATVAAVLAGVGDAVALGDELAAAVVGAGAA